MSQKFAPITASLLVRKGDAAPSAVVASASFAPAAPAAPSAVVVAAPIAPQPPVVLTLAPAEAPTVTPTVSPAVTLIAEVQARVAEELPRPRFMFKPEPVVAQAGEGKPDSEKPRRIVLTLTPHEYETLGLVAVKKGVTRHILAQQAMDAYFEWLVAEYGEACNCIVGGALCRCECAH